MAACKCNRNRVLKQLNEIRNLHISERLKFKIIYNYGIDEILRDGESSFTNCSIKLCKFTRNETYVKAADAILLQRSTTWLIGKMFLKPKHQIWTVYSIESPRWDQFVVNKLDLTEIKSHINGTITPRRDSTIPRPNGLFTLYNNFTDISDYKTPANVTIGKTKLVPMLASNCGDTTTGRLNYAKELAKYITVDIYGRCDDLKCFECDSMLK